MIYATTLLALATLTGCGEGEADSQSESAATTTTRTPRITDNSGRPQVTFDPCLDLPDSVLTQAGYDPATKKTADYPMEYTFLGCSYRTQVRQYSLSMLSGNVTFAEEVEKTAEYAQPIDINGRNGLLEFNPSMKYACAVSLETDYGVLILSRNLFKAGAPESEWCAGLEDTARLIEPLIDRP
ncbi:DUF3558 domain-containing protein [Rhodococcus sp. NPDC058521]|uniref:DUF3558 domain-containing protein n=1 Tax=Rhodococcus sp. NPDC058521 TaxID=3346536 RepID=UPI0036477E2D